MKAFIVSVYIFVLCVMAILLWLQVLGIATPRIDHWMIPIGKVAFWTAMVTPWFLFFWFPFVGFAHRE